MRVLRIWAPIVLAVGVAAAGTSGCAQTQVYTTRPMPAPVAPQALSVEGAALRLGRVADVLGVAQTWDADQRAWVPLFVNRALSVGDRVRTEAGSRVEVQIGSLQVFVGPASEVEWPALDESRTLIRLAGGSMAVHVRQADWARTLELLTDEARMQPLGIGLFRIDRGVTVSTGSGGAPPSAASGAGPRSSATVLQGLLRVNHPGPRIDLRPGQRIEWASGQALPLVEAVVATSPDAFGVWLAGWQQAQSLTPPVTQEVPSEMTGVDGLERYGQWERHPEYGMVWSPAAVRPGWEPYQQGRWLWMPASGWVWWEDAPWGFAPYHYGAWTRWGSRWVWAPRLPRPRPPMAGHPLPRPPVSGAPAAPPVTLWPGARDPFEERSVRTPRWDRRPQVDGRDDRPGAGVVPPAPPTLPAPRSIPPGVTPPAAAVPSPGVRIDSPGAGRERPDRPDRPDRIDRGERPDRERPDRDRQERERKPAL